MIQSQPLYHLKRGPNLPTVEIFREDLEAAILDNKDLASLGHWNIGRKIPETFSNVGQKTPTTEEAHHEPRGFFEALKQGLLEIKDTFSGLLLGAGNEGYEQPEIGDLEPVEPENQPRKKSFTQRIKSGVNELIQDVTMAMNDSSTNLLDKDKQEQDKDKDKPLETREPRLGQTDPSVLYGMRNWEGLTHYQG